jgi:hypothetical protein
MDRLIQAYRNRFSTGSSVSHLLSNNIHYAALIIIFCYIGYSFLRLPILSTGDTDMWYHLSGGRYFFQYHKIPTTGFFSFLAQSREWSNYYWLFQVLIYLIYITTSYYGLIIFKTVVFLITGLTIVSLLFKDTNQDKQKIYFLILFVILSIGLIERYYSVLRPHMFSYLFIPLFIYLLESRTRALIVMPLLTALWVNVHGIEYPVIFLIVSSYLFEFLVKRFKDKTPITKDDLYYIIPIILALFAIFINPYGTKILTAPFSFADNQDQFISELRHIGLNEFFTFALYPFINNLVWSSINILIIVACAGCIKGLWNKKIRISHLLLFTGGMFLLTQAIRFRYEAIMLALPLLKYHPLISLNNKDSITRTLKLTSFSIIILSFLLIFHSIFSAGGKYPFSYTQFPRGITTFLNHIGVGGSVLNEPSIGGYLQWELDPKYKIAMDLQTILFSDKDYFSVMSALGSKEGFASFSGRFHPDFIIAGKDGEKTIKEFIDSFPEYKLVFFDNSSVLYVNNKSYPEISEHYEIKEIDHYKLIEEDIDKLDKSRVDSMLTELLSMQTIYPDDMLTNLEIGRIYNKRNEAGKALICADTIIRNYPEISHGYVLKGDIYKQSGPSESAIAYYKKALKSAFQFDDSRILKSLALAYNKAGEDKKAYTTMKKALMIYAPESNYKDLWQLGNMALKIGKIDESLKLFNFSLIKAPADDKDFIERLNKQIGKILTINQP